MSLIREALDRTRREASPPPSRLPGGAIPWSRDRPMHGVRRTLAGALILLLTAALGAAAAWWLTREPRAPPPLAALAPAPEPHLAPPSLPAAPPPPARSLAADRPAPVPAAPSAPVPAATAPEPRAPATQPSASPLRAGRYVGAIPLPEGGTLSLDGVVSSATHPVAVINGRLLSPGDIVQGFEVISIGADHVVLSRDGEPFTLALR